MTQKNFDIGKYLGEWREIARMSGTNFEHGCTFAKANYTWDSERKVMLVRNTCFDDQGKIVRESFGEATIPDRRMPSKLMVKFSGPDAMPFPGAYNVYYTDYTRYSLVGGGKYFWILSRTPTIPKEDVAFLLEKVREAGYNPHLLLSNRKLLY